MIVVVIPVSTDNAARAEFGLSWIYQLARREKRGHALLVFDGVHSELAERIKIAAELAFESFDVLIPPSKNTKEKMASPIVRRNNLFMSAAEHCQKNYRCPFMFLEPESTPTNPNWMENIEKLWESQARRYLLTHLRNSEDAPRFPLSGGVYHMGFWGDVVRDYTNPANLEVSWEILAGENIVSRSTKTRAFQPLRVVVEEDFDKVWPEAQVVVYDTAGALSEFLREKGVHLPKVLYSYDVPSGVPMTDNPPQAAIACSEYVHPITYTFKNGQITRHDSAPTKIDRRTKAGRALKAAENGNGAHK